VCRGADIWQVQTVFDQVSLGIPGYRYYPTLALNAGGVPRIAYNDSRTGTLRYAAWDGSNWTPETIATTGSYGGYASLAIDGAGNSEISYYDDNARKVMFAKRDAGTWNAEVIDSVSNYGTSLALDSLGVPHVAYQENHWNQGNSIVRYAVQTSQGWTTQEVAAGFQSGYYPKLALDRNNVPAIEYHQGFGPMSKYLAKWNGTAWQNSTIDSYDWLSESNSLALDSQGNAHVSYINSQYFSLYYAWNVDDSWYRQLVQQGNVGADSSIAIDSLGRPHIAYASGYDVMYASWDGSMWQKEVVYDGGGGLVSLLLDGSDNPHIAFFKPALYMGDDQAIMYAALVPIPEPTAMNLLAVAGIAFGVAHLVRRKVRCA
jgi:hypothetical protein